MSRSLKFHSKKAVKEVQNMYISALQGARNIAESLTIVFVSRLY